ncbi:MAG: HPr family phosphocarrier protein [Elusimicrobiota bacterium]
MQEKTLTIKNKLGLHARPAAQFVQAATKYKSIIKLFKDDQEVDGKSIMGIMTLAACIGSQIKLVIAGEDEEMAMSELTEMIESGFGED